MAKNTVKLKKYVDNVEELVANAAITPGMIVERMSTDKVRAHSTADGPCHVMVALENELEGQEITDAYAADDQVFCWHMVSGEQAYCLLANGENVARGALLASNGDGYLKARGDSAGDEPGSILFTALEAVDMSDSSAADPTGRIEVEKF